jgi:predicted nucleotidyltransferase
VFEHCAITSNESNGMKKIINVLDFSTQAVQMYRQAFDQTLQSVILYGSALTDDFDPGRSDLNLLLLVSNFSVTNIEKAIPIYRKLKKDRFSTPLIFDKKYIKSSLDSFPVEFLTMKLSHKVLWGEDFFPDIFIDKNNLRLQIERELKGKTIHLYEGWIACSNSGALIKNLAFTSLRDFSILFKSVLFLTDEFIPADRKTLLQIIEKKYSFNSQPFSSLYDSLEKNDTKAIVRLFPSYIETISMLSTIIDTHSTGA